MSWIQACRDHDRPIIDRMHQYWPVMSTSNKKKQHLDLFQATTTNAESKVLLSNQQVEGNNLLESIQMSLADTDGDLQLTSWATKLDQILTLVKAEQVATPTEPQDALRSLYQHAIQIDFSRYCEMLGKLLLQDRQALSVAATVTHTTIDSIDTWVTKLTRLVCEKLEPYQQGNVF